jgi:hypothetical protein
MRYLRVMWTRLKSSKQAGGLHLVGCPTVLFFSSQDRPIRLRVHATDLRVACISHGLCIQCAHQNPILYVYADLRSSHMECSHISCIMTILFTSHIYINKNCSAVLYRN